MPTPRSSSRIEAEPISLEQGEQFEQSLAHIREEADRMVDRLQDTTGLDRRDIIAFAVVLLGRQIDLTQAADKFVLVVEGDIRPYDNALQAIILEHSNDDDVFMRLLARVASGLSAE